MKNFNRLTTESETALEFFSVLISGAIVKYNTVKNNGKMNFKNGRLFTSTVPNGIAFVSLEVEYQNVIATGKLLNREDDVREFEQQSDKADNNN